MSNAFSYAQQQRDPRRHLGGIAFVVLFHLLLAWALANGLARDVIKVFQPPLDVRLIEEVKPVVEEPPPPPPPPLERRRIVAQPQPLPPSSYVPPPEVQVDAPEAPVIVAIQTEPPPPVVAPEPPPPPEPVAAAVSVTCPNHLDVRSSVPYPPQALRGNKSGEVSVEFVVDTNGSIGNIRVIRSSDPVFNKAATGAVKRFRCVGQARPVLVKVPFQFELN
ncbi:MAG: energy transducer TonB [Zoogloeaceae bacterium]|jgi:protein TonB|nr:energy transducer TonB [Zoogloeaceae bacterium]